LFFCFCQLYRYAGCFFYNPEKERALPILTLTFCLVLCVSAYVTLGIKLHHQQHNRSAVVIPRETELLSPANNNVIQKVHSGLIVKIVQDNGNYYVVRLPDNQIGRLPKEVVRKVI